MRLKEQIDKDKETIKRLDTKQRGYFIWDYYKLPILTIILIVALVVTGISIAASQGKTALYVVMVNANNEIKIDPFSPLLIKAGLSMDGRKVDIEANYTLHYDNETQEDAQTIHVLAALFGIGNLDAFVADEPVFASYAKQKAFVDLSLFISADVLKAHKDDLYYCETEDGKKSVCGIWLRHGSFLHTAGYYNDDVIIGVAANAQNIDNALAAVKQFLQEDG
jgi:hypothetical protein